MLNLIDPKACSFAVTDFTSAEEHRKWGLLLTVQQRMELLRLMNEARWGKERMSERMDRTKIEALSMEEFNAVKEAQHAADQAWFEEKRREFLAIRHGHAGNGISTG